MPGGLREKLLMGKVVEFSLNCLIVPEDDRAAALDVCIVLKEPNKVHGDTVLEHAGAESSGL